MPRLGGFGEVWLRGESATGYARVDWYTPDGLNTWGDGRLMMDEPVFEGYGWDLAMTDEQLLDELLKLNLSRAATPVPPTP